MKIWKVELGGKCEEKNEKEQTKNNNEQERKTRRMILRHVTDVWCGSCRNMWPFAQRYSAARAQTVFRGHSRAFGVQTGPKHKQHNRASVIKQRRFQTWHSQWSGRKKNFWNWGKILSPKLRSFSTRMGYAVAQLVEPLWYKFKGRGFDTRWYHLIFSFT